MSSSKLNILLIFVVLFSGSVQTVFAKMTDNRVHKPHSADFQTSDSLAYSIRHALNEASSFDDEISDTLKVKPFAYSDNDFKPFYSEKAFQYGQKPVEANSLWTKFLMRLLKILSPVLSSKITTYFIYLIIFGACAYLLLRFLGGDADGFWQPDQSISIQAQELEEDLLNTNLDELVQKELALGNYNKAVRLLFLKSIQQLGNKHLIRWQKDRTNLDYQMELGNIPLKQSFAEIVRIYEYAWYGNQRVDKNYFGLIRERFDNFSRMINE